MVIIALFSHTDKQEQEKPILCKVSLRLKVVFSYNTVIIDLEIINNCITTCMSLGLKGNQELQGVIPNSFGHIFGTIDQMKDHQYLVRVSYLEIYMVSYHKTVINSKTK